MRYIESPGTDAFFNMALEEYVFESLPKTDGWFMLWQNRNAVVVGRYQNTAQEVNAAFVREKGISVVRRLSGGGAMYQDLGNLNFTFVVDQDGAKGLDFSLFTAPVVRALAQMGVKAETGRRNDILIDGKKFSGNAQYNKKGRTMHHGTLLYHSDLSMIGRALNPKQGRVESKAVKSVPSAVANIADYMPQKPPMAEFKKALVAEMFRADETLAPYVLTADDLRAVKRLRDEKYARWEWNYGRSPAYSHKKQRRWPFGGVEAALEVEAGHVKDIAFTGDFFGNGDIEELATALRGVPLRHDAVAAALEGVEVGRFIHGMDAALLAELLLE